MSGALVKPPRLREGSASRAPTLHRIPWHLPYNREKSRKTLSQCSRKALGWTAPDATRLVDVAIAGDGLDWPVGPCRPWLLHQAMGSTLGQRKYLPNCRTRGFGGFPTLANFESKLAVRALSDVVANSGTPKSSCVCPLFTYQGAPVARRRQLDLTPAAFGGHGCEYPPHAISIPYITSKQRRNLWLREECVSNIFFKNSFLATDFWRGTNTK